MAIATGSGPAQQPHVPAWKRLGLKLKYAKDTAEPPSTLQHSNHSDSTLATETQPVQPNSPTGLEDGRPSKKRKTSSSPFHATRSDTESSVPEPSSERPVGQQEDRSYTEDSAAKASETASAGQAQSNIDLSGDLSTLGDQRKKTAKRRKSVTFTEGTKQTDGNSAEPFPDPELHAGTWNAALPTSEATVSGEKKPKRAKKSKKEASEQEAESKSNLKQKKASTNDVAVTEKPEYLRYLEQFHHDKASWKFNKNHQTTLLKNVFDIRKIPASLTPAVVDYISGLKGAGPRERLVENAVSILRTFAEKDVSLEEIDAMNTASARKEAYFKALARHLKKWEDAGMPRSEYDDNQLEDMREEAERGKRAEAILSALPLSELQSQLATPSMQASSQGISQASGRTGVDGSPTQTTATSTSQPKTKSTRKRKKRIDAFSSSDSDSSSSDSEADTAPPIKGPTSVAAALRPTPATASKPKFKAPPPSYHQDNLNVVYRPQNASQVMNMSIKPTKKIFDEDLLDQAFPPRKTYNEVAPKRRKGDGEKEGKKKARGFAYTHGTRVDESGSEDED